VAAGAASGASTSARGSSCGSSMTEVCAPRPPNMRGRAAVH
jgi:hypothetical protein